MNQAMNHAMNKAMYQTVNQAMNKAMNQAIEFAKTHGIHKCFETSAKTGLSVDTVFSCAGKNLYLNTVQ